SQIAKQHDLNTETVMPKAIQQSAIAKDENQFEQALIKLALEQIDEAQPSWTFVAAQVYLQKLYREAAENRQYARAERYGSFYQLIQILINKNIYRSTLLEKYSLDEI